MDEIPIRFIFSTDTVVALVTLAGVILSVGFASSARKNARGANLAVNNRKPEEPMIYDMVKDSYVKLIHMEGWKESYEGGPLDSGPKVVEFVNKVEGISDDVNDLKIALAKNNPDKLHEDIAMLRQAVQDTREDIVTYGCPVKLDESGECIRKKRDK